MAPRNDLPLAEFLANAFVNQHVCVHRHADGEHHTRDTRQGERRADGTHDAHQNDDVRDQRDVRHNAREQIIAQHEAGNQNHADNGRANAAANRVFAERRVNIAGINKNQRRAQRILEDIGQFLSCLDGEISRDLNITGFNRRLNDRRGIQLAVQHDGHPLADVIARHFAKSFRAHRH